MMRKIFVACVCILFALSASACGGANAKEQEETKSPTATATPLTYKKASDNKEDLYTSNVVETQEGVTIMCTSNYVLGPEAEGQFLFMLSDVQCKNLLHDKEVDWNVQFTSSAHIYQADFYDYEDSLIASEKCEGIVDVDQDYQGTYIDKVILHIEYDGKLYSAEFVRSGA